MTKKIKHICTVNNTYRYEIKHLVEIDKKNVVFIFNYDKEIKAIKYKNVYAFAGLKKANEIRETIKTKGINNLKLDIYEKITNDKFDNSYYLNLYTMQLKFNKVWNKFSNVLNVIEREVKNNDTVLMFPQ